MSRRGDLEILWSFKGYRDWGRDGYIGHESWLAEYWNFPVMNAAEELWGWIEPVLVLMLEAQVLTVLFSVLTILKVRSYLFLSAVILNVFVALCMWFVSNALYLQRIASVGFELGFWFSLLSIAAFSAGFILSLKRLPRTTKQPAIEKKTIP